jgi:nicotinamide mononucleotide transporter PnuC
MTRGSFMKKTKLIFDYALMLAVAAMIIVFAVLREQSIIKTLPTLITLAVQMLLVKANRFAFLLGGINAMLYGVAYFTEGLYFSLVSAVLISAPIQLYSFVAWSKNARGGQAELKFLKKKHLMITLAVSVAGWMGCYFGLSWLFAGQSYPLLDTYIFVMGITVSFLAAWRYIESQYLNIISSVLSLTLWVLLTVRDPSNFNYVIISTYNLYRIIQASVVWTRKYYQSKKEKEKLA